MVIDTSSRPPGDRSTSISRTGGAVDAGLGTGAPTLGAMSAPPAADPSAANGAAAPNGAESGAPNGPACASEGAAGAAGSGERPPGALPSPPDSAGGRVAAEVAIRSTEGRAAGSDLGPLRAASLAGRMGLTRFA